MFVDELVCMLKPPSTSGLALVGWCWGWVGFFELTNDDSGDCLLVDRVLSGFCLMSKFSMESLILAQDERWRRA